MTELVDIFFVYIYHNCIYVAYRKHCLEVCEKTRWRRCAHLASHLKNLSYTPHGLYKNKSLVRKVTVINISVWVKKPKLYDGRLCDFFVQKSLYFLFSPSFPPPPPLLFSLLYIISFCVFFFLFSPCFPFKLLNSYYPFISTAFFH